MVLLAELSVCRVLLTLAASPFGNSALRLMPDDDEGGAFGREEGFSPEISASKSPIYKWKLKLAPRPHHSECSCQLLVAYRHVDTLCDTPDNCVGLVWRVRSPLEVVSYASGVINRWAVACPVAVQCSPGRLRHATLKIGIGL